MLNEEQLQKLLKLKRHETPGDDYFARFLDEFHHRQRADLARLPAWRLALDRVSGMFVGFRVPQVAYAGAFAVFLLLGAIVGIPGIGQDGILSFSGSGGVAAAGASSGGHGVLSLDGSEPFRLAGLDVDADAAFARMPAGAGSAPRYVLDTRPVSYDPPFSF